MWYAVETAFIDGKHFASRLCFDPKVESNGFQPGTCMCGHQEEPHNSCETHMGGRIEIHIDWFQTKEQAKKFAEGQITYRIHKDVAWLPKNQSHISYFRKWEVVLVDKDRPPFIGIYEQHEVKR